MIAFENYQFYDQNQRWRQDVNAILMPLMSTLNISNLLIQY